MARDQHGVPWPRGRDSGSRGSGRCRVRRPGILAAAAAALLRQAVSGTSRRAGILAAVAAAALLVAACGGSSGGSSGGSGASGSTPYQQALAYSQCMRGHGEPGFPDPDSKGNILINGQQDHLAGGSIMAAANKACQHLMPRGAPMTAAQQRQITAQALRFVACMRAHGLPAMPDPVVNANGVQLQVPPGGGPNSPVFQAAQRACQNLMPGGPP